MFIISSNSVCSNIGTINKWEIAFRNEICTLLLMWSLNRAIYKYCFSLPESSCFSPQKRCGDGEKQNERTPGITPRMSCPAFISVNGATLQGPSSQKIGRHYLSPTFSFPHVHIGLQILRLVHLFPF